METHIKEIIQIHKEAMTKKRITTIQKCLKCGNVGYVDNFLFGYECECYNKFYLEHNRSIAKNRINNFYEEVKKLKISNYYLYEDFKNNNNNNNISLESIINKDYKNVPGVWALWGINTTSSA